MAPDGGTGTLRSPAAISKRVILIRAGYPASYTGRLHRLIAPAGELEWRGLRMAGPATVQNFGADRGAPPEAPRGSNLRRRWPVLIGLLFFVGVFARPFVLVGAGERAVIFNRFTGTQPVALGEGLHLLIPWVQAPIAYDVKTHAYTMSQSLRDADREVAGTDALTALTADGLPVSLDISVLYHPDPAVVARLHREIGPRYLEKIVRPQTRAEVRMVVAQYPVIDLYGARRSQIVEEVNARLRAHFAQSYVLLDELLLRDVRFSESFQQTIEQKQVAQQEVQRMRFVLDQAEKERQRKIVEAEGEAESIRLKAAALNRNPQLVQYEYVKSLPAKVRTVVAEGRTIVSLDAPVRPEVAAAAENGR